MIGSAEQFVGDVDPESCGQGEALDVDALVMTVESGAELAGGDARAE